MALRFQLMNTGSCWLWALFSAAEQKAQMHYCDHALSVRPSSLTIFIFSTSLKSLNEIQRNYRKLDLDILYKVSVLSGRLEKQDGHPGL